MLLRLLMSHRRRRAMVHRRATWIITIYGNRGWSVARSRAFDACGIRQRENLALEVAECVRRKLKLGCGTDTAMHAIGQGSGRKVSCIFPDDPLTYAMPSLAGARLDRVVASSNVTRFSRRTNEALASACLLD